MSPAPKTSLAVSWKATRLSPAATLRATSAGAGRSISGIWLVEIAGGQADVGLEGADLDAEGLEAV